MIKTIKQIAQFKSAVELVESTLDESGIALENVQHKVFPGFIQDTLADRDLEFSWTIILGDNAQFVVVVRDNYDIAYYNTVCDVALDESQRQCSMSLTLTETGWFWHMGKALRESAKLDVLSQVAPEAIAKLHIKDKLDLMIDFFMNNPDRPKQTT